jgi:hypothetical protein
MKKLILSLLVAVALIGSASASVLTNYPSIIIGQGPSAGNYNNVWPNGSPEIAIGTWPLEYGDGYPYNLPGRLYLGFSSPFIFENGINFQLYKSAGGFLGTSADFYFLMGDTIVGSYSENNMLSNGLYSYEIPLVGTEANGIVVVNTSPRIIGNSSMNFSGAWVGSPIAGEAASNTFPNNSLNIYSNSIPEPSTYALFGLGAIGMLMVLRRKKTA